MNMSTPVYHGGLVADPRAAALAQAEAGAEPTSPPREDDNLTATCEVVNPHLQGETATAAGSPVHAEVPNLVVTKVTNPARVNTLPASVSTDQSAFTAATPKNS
jgi:hypothetical protein